MNRRPFLLGLGIGMAAGALLLQLMLAGRDQPRQLEQLTGLNDGEPMYTQAELDERLAAAEARIRQQLAAEADEPDESGSGEEETATPNEPPATAPTDGAADGGESGGEATAADEPAGGTAAAGSDPAADAVAVSDRIVRIRPGMSLEQVAALLEDEGVIADRERFRTLMAGDSTKIRAGFFRFDGELTPEDVRTIIMTPPLNPEDVQ